MATKISTGARKLPWNGKVQQPVTLPGTGQTETPVAQPYYMNGRSLGDTAIKPVQQPVGSTQGAFAAQPQATANPTAYQKYLDDYTKGLSVSTPVEQAKWQSMSQNAAAGGTDWAKALEEFSTAGNWNNYTDANGMPVGYLKNESGRAVGNYLPVMNGKVAYDGLPGNPEDYRLTDAGGDQWGLDADWNLMKTGTAAQAAAEKAAAQASQRNDGGLHGTFRGSDGKIYDYDTASDADLARFGFARNQITGLVGVMPSPADAMNAAAQAAAGRTAKSYGYDADGSYTPDVGRDVGNGGSSGYGSTGYGSSAYDYGGSPSGQTAYQRALAEYDYGTAPEWEGTEYERLRDEALKKASSGEWNYNPSTDPVWQAYQKQYRREGQRAAEDTLGRAAAMTGGVPSSYAVTAAAQAGNNYAAALSDKLPELYQDSYNRYLQEYQRQLGLADAYAGAGKTEYNRYLDRRDQWNTDRNFRYNLNRDAVSDERYDREWAQKLREYADEQNWKQKDWEQYLREHGDQLSEQERQWAYQQYRDSVSDARYEDETAWNRGKYEDETAYQRQMDEWEREYGLGRDAVEDSRYESKWQEQLRQQEIEEAWDRVQYRGYVDERDAAILGLPVGAYAGGGSSGGYSGGGSSGSRSSDAVTAEPAETPAAEETAQRNPDSGMGSRFVNGVRHENGTRMTAGFRKWWPIIRDAFDQGAAEREITDAVDVLIRDDVIADYEKLVILNKLGMDTSNLGLNTGWRSR